MCVREGNCQELSMGMAAKDKPSAHQLNVETTVLTLQVVQRDALTPFGGKKNRLLSAISSIVQVT